MMTPEKTFYATGRRKEAIARVWLLSGQKGFHINGIGLGDYLKRPELRILVEQPLTVTKLSDQFFVRANVRGGGISGQAGAIRLGVSRALLKYDETLRVTLRRAGFLTRDPREKERKKFGHKGARKSFQYTKR
jgi:small subunit ribosomal protein S9